jgi:hypothetical protein
MILTRDYLPVLASFDSPKNFLQTMDDTEADPFGGAGRRRLYYKFQVGPFLYELAASCWAESEIWDIEFHLERIKGSPAFLKRYLSKLYGKTLSDYDVMEIKEDLMISPTGNLNIGGTRPVFANVLGIVSELVKNYPVRCLVFYVYEKSKSDLYRRMIKTYLKEWVVERDTGDFFRVCKNKEE